jgi:hypothetical protein
MKDAYKPKDEHQNEMWCDSKAGATLSLNGIRLITSCIDAQDREKWHRCHYIGIDAIMDGGKDAPDESEQEDRT